MAGFRVEGDTSGAVAEVDSGKHLLVTGNTNGGTFDEATAGKFMVVDAEGEPMVFDYEGRVDTSRDSLVFHDGVEGTALDRRKWLQVDTTMTTAQASGVITLNSGSSVTTGQGTQITSLDQWPTFHEASLYWHARVRPTNLPLTSAQGEVGFGFVSGVAAPTDGVFFRWKSSDATFRCVISFGGSETESAAQTAPALAEFNHMEILFNTERAIFIWEVSGTPMRYEVAVPTGVANVTSSTRQPAFARVYNSGTPASAPQMGLAEVAVYRKLLEMNQDYGPQMAAIGNISEWSPVTTFGQTGNYPANTTAPTTRTLANATPCETTLGGHLAFTPTVVVDTDYPLFAYTVPTGWTLNVTSISWVAPYFMSGTGAATAFIAALMYGLNATAGSLAGTADTFPATIIPRRGLIGWFNLAASPVNATVPTQVPSAQQIYNPPLRVNSARLFHIILRSTLARTAGASEVLRMHVGVHGYFE